ncbi:nucleoside deaminase [Teredinibacter turnerae]|uniref:nucleoside deaminase n=1 Tax=Teredinibacter turnerae TaxID=2426 RepID=UPI000377B01F|nr:nucleoside deaminase [Teredinibacter turnerae]
MAINELQLGIDATYQQALKSFHEGGVPIGSCIMQAGQVVAVGHNHRIQCGSNIRHGETDCIEKCGHTVDFSQVTLFSSLTPCLMCTGAIILYSIPRVVILDNINIHDYETNLDMLRERNVEVTILNHKPSIELNRQFQRSAETRKLWLGDVGE